MVDEPPPVASPLPLPSATIQILLSLADGERHGYGIMQEVESRTGGDLRLSAGTISRTIQRLLEQGLLIEVAERPAPGLDDERRRDYRLTPNGRAVARAEAQRLADLVRMARAVGFAPERAQLGASRSDSTALCRGSIPPASAPTAAIALAVVMALAGSCRQRCGRDG